MAILLFDIDGTLTRGGSNYGPTMQRAIEEVYGAKVPVNFNDFHGYTDRLLMKSILSKNSISYNTKSLDKCLKLFGEMFPENPQDIKIIPGVIETIPVLEDAHITGLVTGNVQPMARKKLRKFSANGTTLDSYFPFGGFGSDPHIKRADLIHLALERAGRIYNFELDNVGNRVYVVDDSKLGIKAALEARVNPIGITTGTYSKKDLEAAGAKYIVNNIGKIPSLLVKLGAMQI